MSELDSEALDFRAASEQFAPVETLRTERIGEPVRDSTDQAILDLLSEGEGRSTSEIAAHIELTPRATRTRLAALVERGLVREVGSSPQDPKRRYFRTESP
jgi:ATP-dependent DNA helicase RecG